MRLLLLAILLSMANVAFAQTRWSDMTVTDIMDTLDMNLERASQYDAEVRARIFEQKLQLWRQPIQHRAHRYQAIGEMYAHVDIDSALRYFDLGMRVAELNNDASDAMMLRLARLRVMPFKGLVHQSLTAIDAIDPSRLEPELRGPYYYARHVIYSNSIDAEGPDTVRNYSINEARIALDSALAYNYARVSDNASADFWKTLTRPDIDTDIKLETGWISVLDTMRADNPDMPLMAAMLAMHAEERADHELAKRYYAVSAIGDLVQGRAESTSLNRLGRLLSQEGNNDRAYRYITSSLNRAVSGGARLRALEAAESLPMVIKAAEQRAAKSRRQLTFCVMTLGMLVLALAAAFITQFRSRRRQKLLEQKLSQANAAKDACITKLLEAYTANIDSMDSFNRVAARKIKASQTRELLQLLESDEIIEKQLHEFYQVFDQMFLELHPDFVKHVNALLEDQYHYSQPSDTGECLNVELRMLALMAMGITESSRLARLLGLYVNSVYTYRTKLKTRALDRDAFDDNIKKIGQML